MENGIYVCPCRAQGSASGNARKTSASNIMVISAIVTVSQIKFTLKCFLNSLLYFIGLLGVKNERQYLVWYIFITLLFIII